MCIRDSWLTVNTRRPIMPRNATGPTLQCSATSASLQLRCCPTLPLSPNVSVSSVFFELSGKPAFCGPLFRIGRIDCQVLAPRRPSRDAVSYTHLRAHETPEHLVCRL